MILTCLTILCSTIANASFSEVPNPCQADGVNHLHVQGFERFKNIDGDTDLCQNYEVLKENRQLLDVVKTVNGFLGQISVQFNLPIEQIVPKGINLHLKANSLGSISSSGDGKAELTLTEFPNWDGIIKSPFVLVHELAHFIPDHISNNSPLHDFGHGPFLEEGFPDLLAAYITHSDGLKMVKDDLGNDELASIFSRDLSKSISYSEPLGFFTGDLFAEKYSGACRRLGPSSRTLPLCAALEGEGIDLDSHAIEIVNNAKVENNLKPFSVSSFNEELQPDLHTIALPWISAIYELGPKANLTFLTALLSPSEARYKNTIACSFRDQSETRFTIFAPNFLSFIADFTTKLDPQETKRWNLLKRNNRLSLSIGLLFRETNKPLTFQVYQSVSNDSNMRAIQERHPYCKNEMAMVGENCAFSCRTLKHNMR